MRGGKINLAMRLRSHAKWPWILPVIGVLLLAAPSVTLPGDDLGIRGFVTPSLGPNVALGQTFVMTAAGLRSIEVFPVSIEDGPSGEVRFDLYELYGVGEDYRETLMRTAVVSAPDLLRGPSYRFAFAPIASSSYRVYRLDVIGSAAEGVAFWATKGTRYEGGTMEINGLARWADLTFAADAAIPSIGALLMYLRDTHPARAYAVMVAFPVIWLLVGYVMRTLEALADESGAIVRLETPMTGPV
jgi:hypothetical protein